MTDRGVLIVTGGSRGIGAAIARRAAADGYAVAVNFERDAAAADSVVRQIVADGGRAIPIQADIGREQDILTLFETADHQLGPLRALVNNAGITGGLSRADAIDSAVISRMLQVNVLGVLLCCREAVRRMSTARGGSGGAIVNISSLVTRTGGAGEWVHYAASKGAINSFTIGLAREVAAEGIRVNAASPGLVETEIHAASGAPDRLERMAPMLPMQRAGTPEEIAEGVAWLLSPAASYTAGAILEIGGAR